MEWWSNGVMKGPIHIKFGLSFLPILQYSNTPVFQYSSTPILQYSKRVLTCTGKAIVF
jgi:hypothetical protein